MPHISALAQMETLNILAKIARLEDETKEPAYHKAAADKPGYDGRDKPVVAVAVFRRDVVTLRNGQGAKSGPISKRGEIKEMSEDSLKRLAFVANNADAQWLSMVTLTYPAEFPTNGQIVKAHLQNMLRSFKRRLGEPMTYIWFLEFQRRGAPHIHLLLENALTEESKREQREWLSKRWYEIVASNDLKHLAAGTQWANTRQADGLRHYVVKYAFKCYQKEVPEDFWHVGRFWGASKNVKVKPILIQATDDTTIKGCLIDWPHSDVLEQRIPRVLFNASQYWKGESV